MTDSVGMLSVETLAGEVQAGEIDTVIVVFTDLYGRFMGKRYDAGFFLESAVADGAHACDYLLTVDMDMEPVQGYGFANWGTGYGDVHLLPDLSTLRVASWLERTALVLCDVADREGHGLLPIAPRSLLQAAVGRAEAAGFQAMAATELEFFLFEGSYRDAHDAGYAGLRPAGWAIEDYHTLQATRVEPYVGALRRHLSASGVPVENSKGEWGKGQHELNVRYTEALAMADRHAIYKQCAKELAELQGRAVTFMAKPHADAAGSSCHIHLSLWHDGSNAFAGDDDHDGIASTDVFRWFLGGWLKHAPDVMAFYAPTVNSYKRHQPGSWAPTSLAWSGDNRTAGFRVVGRGSSLRIECRIPGADCNPYLALAASLASGLDGVANKIEPPPRFDGDVYNAEGLDRLPATLGEATDRLEASAFARAAFGEDVIAHYAHFFRTEQAAYDRAVTDWERSRYFEQT
jgi:glutamine synthetase